MAGGRRARRSRATPTPAAGMPAREIRFRDVTFAYRPDLPAVLEGFDLTIPAGTSMAIVGVNGAGKTTLAKLLCRLYDPQHGSIEIDGVDLRELDPDAVAHPRHRGVPGLHPLRAQSPLQRRAHAARSDEAIVGALHDAGAFDLADLDTILAKAYANGIDVSGGQWQRVALARALCAVREGAGVVLLDEPTAQLDVRGEAEIFTRVLDATRHTTTILVSHRFSTVRQADRICVVDHGRVVELGTHDELMAAARPLPHDVRPPGVTVRRDVELDEHGEEVVHDSLDLTTSRRRCNRCGARVKLGYRAEPRGLAARVRDDRVHGAPRRVDRAVAQVPRRRLRRARPDPRS